MYRLLIIADDGGKQTMLTIGGEQKSFIKSVYDFIRKDVSTGWYHGSNEKLVEALFIGLMEKWKEQNAKQEAQQ